MTATQRVESTTAEVAIENDGFGDDALGRVQGLLFGDHAQRTNDRIDTLERSIGEMMSELRAAIDMQLAQLGERLDHEVQRRESVVSELDARLTQEVKLLAKDDKALVRKVDRANEALRNRIGQTAEKASAELATARQELADETELQLNRRVERGSLAELLRATASELES